MLGSMGSGGPILRGRLRCALSAGVSDTSGHSEEVVHTFGETSIFSIFSNPVGRGPKRTRGQLVLAPVTADVHMRGRAELIMALRNLLESAHIESV